MDWINQCHFGDCLAVLRDMPDGLVQTCVTSPPYFGLRDYGHAGQIGLEPTPDEFIAKLVTVFREVRRVLRDDGTLFLRGRVQFRIPGGGRSGPAGAPSVLIAYGQTNADALALCGVPGAFVRLRAADLEVA